MPRTEARRQDYQAKMNPDFISRERECNACGRPMKTTPKRRMLCEGCFTRASGPLFSNPAWLAGRRKSGG